MYILDFSQFINVTSCYLITLIVLIFSLSRIFYLVTLDGKIDHLKIKNVIDSI